jgi:hypothetical protein
MVGLLGVFGDLIDKVVPDANKRLELKAQAAQAEHDGQFKELEERMAAIVMEAKSKDPWTSRARPSFLYVMYILILSAIPIGALFVFWPEEVQRAIHGFRLWLAAIPPELYGLFGAGYLGYTNKRSQDKAASLGQPVSQGLMSKILG